MTLLDIWINCPDVQTARAIAQTVVERRLAACANIHAEIESLYWWKGAVEQAREIPLVIKTRPELFDRVAEVARTLHPDETPAIHGVEAAEVTADYRNWLRDETQAVEPSQDGAGFSK